MFRLRAGPRAGRIIRPAQPRRIERILRGDARSVKIEVEAFHYGGVWNAMRMVEKGLMQTPVWVTFFLGWKGGCWTPPTTKAMDYMADHCPDGFIWNTSVMDPEEHWKVLSAAIMLGGHVRVGMEDNPFMAPGTYARSNAELVEKIVRISRDLGREVASA